MFNLLKLQQGRNTRHFIFRVRVTTGLHHDRTEGFFLTFSDDLTRDTTTSCFGSNCFGGIRLSHFIFGHDLVSQLSLQIVKTAD